jgi:hypothetical protein
MEFGRGPVVAFGDASDGHPFTATEEGVGSSESPEFGAKSEGSGETDREAVFSVAGSEPPWGRLGAGRHQAATDAVRDSTGRTLDPAEFADGEDTLDGGPLAIVDPNRSLLDSASERAGEFQIGDQSEANPSIVARDGLREPARDPARDLASERVGSDNNLLDPTLSAGFDDPARGAQLSCRQA